jgi:pilus assembly protein Flp/PilA
VGSHPCAKENWQVMSLGGQKMQFIAKKFIRFVKKEDGPTAVEYAVMLALIVVVCIAAITTLGSNANNTFASVGNKMGSTSS